MKSIKRIVEKLIHIHQTNDPFKIAKERGIVVVHEPLGNIMGYYHTYKRISFIHINQYLDEQGQRLTCAHELGHGILHPRVNTPYLKAHTFFSTDKIEVEANTFAVELLMPDEFLYEHSDTNLSIYKACDMYGVPKEMADLKNIMF